MIAKLARTCTLRISPEKLNFILWDRQPSGGASTWCELEQVSQPLTPIPSLGHHQCPRKATQALLFQPLGELFQ